MSRYRILLVTPPYHPYNLADEKVYVVEPIQFEVLASLLDPAQFEVVVLDLRLERRQSAFLSMLASYRPNAVGFTSWTMHVASVRRHMAMVKAFDPSIVTMVGGHHAGITPADFADPNVDYIFMGENYQSFPEAMKRCRENIADVSDIPGMAWQQDGCFVSNGSAIVTKHFDLDAMPFPDRTILGQYRGKYYHLWWKPVASLRTGLGCPSRCNFCNLWRPNLGKYLTWSAEYVVEFLKTIQEPFVLFVDDHFFGDVRRAFRIGELILKNGIKKQYCLYSRSDAIAKHPELVELWSRVGLRRVRMGLESYSDIELDSLTKCNSVENNDQAISILKRHNIFIEGLFMIRLDYTERQFDELAAYILSRKIEVPNITVYTPMPGTSEYTRVENQLEYRDSEYFDFQHAVLKTTLDLQRFCRLYGRLLLKVQRPPHEQIKRIGLPLFIRRMPAFWRYFYSVYTSDKHYRSPPAEKTELPRLPWREVSLAA